MPYTLYFDLSQFALHDSIRLLHQIGILHFKLKITISIIDRKKTTLWTLSLLNPAIYSLKTI